MSTSRTAMTADPRVELLAEALHEAEDPYLEGASLRQHRTAEAMLAASPRLAAALSRWPSPDDETAVAELAAIFEADGNWAMEPERNLDTARAILERLAKP